MATGVASPNAQGQEITSTQMAQDKANSKVAPDNNHTAPVMSAIHITVGTKIPAILSARRAMGALLELASSTRRIIPANAVSSPTFSASILIKPALLMVAPTTRLPTSL